MLSEYEKNRTLNKELMKNIGSPKGPMFARMGNGSAPSKHDHQL